MNKRQTSKQNHRFTLYSVLCTGSWISTEGIEDRNEAMRRNAADFRLEFPLREWSLWLPVVSGLLQQRRICSRAETRAGRTGFKIAREMLVLLDVSQGSGPDHRAASVAVAR